ncbi:MAG: FliG C-terminal domain-containing protein [Oleispira sp.]
MKIILQSVLKLCLACSVICPAVYSFAETGKTFEVPAKKDEIEEVRFKDEMEARLNRDLQAYLGNNRFIIHVEAELKKTRTVVQEGSNSDAKNIPERPVFTSQPLPASIGSRPVEVEETLPGLPTSDLPIFEDNSVEVNALKGRVQQLENERQQALGYAEKLRIEAEKQIEKIKEKTLGYRNSINKLTITIVLDKNLMDEQVEFIRNLITRKARLDELRGDSLKIVRTVFKDVEKKNEVLDWWQQYQGWIMLACFGFMMLLLLFALYLFNKRLSDSLRENQRRSDNFDNLTVPAAVEMAPIANSKDSSLDSANDKRRQLNEMRQELVTIGLGQPQLFQQRINEQLNSGNSQNVAALYDVLGKGLFRSLCPKIASADSEALADQAERQSLDDEQRITSLNNLRHEMLKALGDDDNGNAPFAFLEKLNDSQVLYLIKEEETRIKALVLSQMPAKRGASLVQRLEGHEQSAVAYELGEFETLPVSTFKDVADRLAQKSLNVPSFENVSANGLSVLINMLDTMSSGEETRLLKTLKADKPETYYRLRQVYYTYADLMRTPERVIANELRDIDRTVMALSLCNTPTEFKRHILSGLPVKLRSSVIAELKIQEGQAAQEQTEQARNQVVAKMREVLKAGRFSMEELIAVANPN